MIDKDGDYSVQELSDELTGILSFMVPAGMWFAAEIPSASEFSLVSCAVAPGESSRRDARHCARLAAAFVLQAQIVADRMEDCELDNGGAPEPRESIFVPGRPRSSDSEM